MVTECWLNRMCMRICRRSGFVAGRGVEFGIGDEALDARHALQKIDEAAGMDGAVIEIAGVAEPGLRRGSALEFLGGVVAAPVAPVQAVEIGVDEIEKRGREQAVHNHIGERLGGEEGVAQRRDAVGSEKFRIDDFVEGEGHALDRDMIAGGAAPARAGAA